MTELVSVVIPVFNAVTSLEKCVSSILAQDYPYIEIVLVDDGSTDGSERLCLQYSSRYENIRTISINNSGQGVARNEGIIASRGVYITFADADDYLEPTLIREMVAGIEGAVDVVIAGYKRLTGGKITYVEEYLDRIYEHPATDLIYMIQGAYPGRNDQVKGTVWGCLYRRRVLLENNVTFKSERDFFSEDTIFNVDYLSCARSARTISSTGYIYVQNVNSYTHTYDRRKIEAIGSYLLYMIDRFPLDDGEARIRNMSFYMFNLIKCINQTAFISPKCRLSEVVSELRFLGANRIAREVVEGYPIDSLRLRQRLLLRLFRGRMFSLLGIVVYIRARLSRVRKVW